MAQIHSPVQVAALFLYLLLSLSTLAHAGTTTSDRVAAEAGVNAEIAKDLAQTYTPLESLSGRTCLDGKSVDGFQGAIVEYWANLECPYCGVQEAIQTQRAHG